MTESSQATLYLGCHLQCVHCLPAACSQAGMCPCGHAWLGGPMASRAGLWGAADWPQVVT